jgi:PRA1 family protein 1
LGLSRKRHASDELHFTGIDLSTTRPRRRKGIAYDEDSDSSYDDDEDDAYDGQGQHMQIVLREKEDFLVERAWERIRRARMLGKTNVKLSQAEVDALERAERIQKHPDPPRNPKGKKAVSTRPKAEERKRSKSDKPSSSTPPLKAIEPRRKAKTSAREEPQVPYPMMQGPDYGQATGTMVYAPQGYYPLPAKGPRSSGSKSGSRTASSQSLRQQQQQHTPPLPQYQHPYHAGRYFSNPDSAYAGRPPSTSSFRSDPSDPSWEPRARSTSNLVPYPVEQPPYPIYQPPPPQFDPRDPRFAIPSAPRMASGPPDVYPSPPMPGYRHPQDEMFLYSPSTPGEGTTTGDDDDEDDDEDQGVEIDVIEQSSGSYGVQTRSGAATAAGNRGRGGGAVTKRGKRGK